MIERPLTVEEASKVTGMSVGWWRQKIFSKEIRHLKIGKRVLIPQETIEEILTDAIVEPRVHANAG